MNLRTILISNLFIICLLSVGHAEPIRKAVEGHPRQEYFLIKHYGDEVPEEGFKLLIVLPGGSGGAEFKPFITNIGKHAAGKEYLVVQPIAVKWTPEQRIIWPTKKSKAHKMGFTTEEFILNVIREVRKRHKINPEHLYTLTWSSSGPAAYAASLTIPEIRGSFIAMSVFHRKQLPNLTKAKGHRYYLYHSPEDEVCPIHLAKEAEETLSKKGAAVEFTTYEGGHGWHGDLFGDISRGLRWLEDRSGAD